MFTRCLHNTFDNSEKTSSCRLCGEICDNEETLKKHFRSVHSKHLPFQCSICHTEFDTKKAESEHFSTHLDGDNFQCIVCSLNLPTYKDLYFHYKQDHVTKQQSICKICNKIFPNEFLLQKHRCKTEEKQCIFCHKFFSSAASLTIHIKRHTNKKIYKCRICYRAFFDTGDLMKHMLFHATLVGDERPYKCCICFVSYTHKKLLATHITNSHLGKTLSEVKCPICGETSKNDKMMTSHLMRHSMRVSKNNMTKLETEWLKQTGSNPSESPALPKRGRPRKLSSSVCTISDTSQNSRYDPIEYNTRKMHSKINSDSSELENKAEMKCNSEDTGTFDDYLTNGDLWTMTKQQVKSKVGIIKHRKRGTNLKMNSSDVDLSDSSDGRSVKSDLEQFGIRKLHNNVEKSTNDQRNYASSSNLKYNTRGANLKIKSGIAESIGGKSKKEDVSDISNKPKLPIKYNVVQSRINLETTDQSKNSNKLNIESLHQNNIASKQRPMSFIKVTSSRNKNNLKPKQIIRNKNMISQNSKKTMFAKTPSYFAKQHLVGKKRMSEDLQNGKSDSLHSIGDIKIEDEELEMSPIFDKQMYLNSIKTRMNENEHVSNHIKIEDESEILMPYDKNMTWPTIKKEETESFIKEKKYYEPSLGLTEYSCTTCLLSFSSQDELLVHNTQHIL